MRADLGWQCSRPQPLYDTCERIGPNRNLCMPRQAVKIDVVISKHAEEGAPKIMRCQLQFRVEPQHQLPEIAAVLAQFSLAEHFYKWEQLCARCADGIVGGRCHPRVTPSHKASCQLQQFG